MQQAGFYLLIVYLTEIPKTQGSVTEEETAGTLPAVLIFVVIVGDLKDVSLSFITYFGYYVCCLHF